jgi:cytochrome c-type biogenesis protein CcmH/NrfF
MMKPMLRLAILALFVSAVSAHAQRSATATPGNRPALEQQFKERAAKLAQQRLGLTDAQLEKLEQSNARFAPQLRQLAVQERDIRTQLRQEMTAGNSANQQHVSDLLDASIRIQKQRIAVVESEQKDLAGFLTPVQRARYVFLQAQFKKRADELSGQGGRQNQGLGGQRKRRPIGRLP